MIAVRKYHLGMHQGLLLRYVEQNGNRVSLMNSPEQGRSIHKDGRWTLKELAGVFPETIGIDLVNPAPPQEQDG